LYGRILLLAGAVVAAVTAGIERWPRWGKEGKKKVSGRVGCTVRLPVFPLAWKAETSGSVAATGFARFLRIFILYLIVRKLRLLRGFLIFVSGTGWCCCEIV